MTLNEATGNMFQFIDATWNPIAGKCPHNCGYCYASAGFYESMDKYQGKPRLHEKSLDDDLSRYDSYFVANMADMFAGKVPVSAITQVLEHCNRWEGNVYLFLTKNPGNVANYMSKLPPYSVIGTTLETNRGYEDTDAPSVKQRAHDLQLIPRERMISIEPIMDFDMDEFIEMIDFCNPIFVAIGADSQSSGLDEPSKDKTVKLIEELQSKGIITHLKKNITRIIGSDNRDKLHMDVNILME